MKTTETERESALMVITALMVGGESHAKACGIIHGPPLG